jgi:hypothetical protein
MSRLDISTLIIIGYADALGDSLSMNVIPRNRAFEVAEDMQSYGRLALGKSH